MIRNIANRTHCFNQAGHIFVDRVKCVKVRSVDNNVVCIKISSKVIAQQIKM